MQLTKTEILSYGHGQMEETLLAFDGEATMHGQHGKGYAPKGWTQQRRMKSFEQDTG